MPAALMTGTTRASISVRTHLFTFYLLTSSFNFKRNFSVLEQSAVNDKRNICMA